MKIIVRKKIKLLNIRYNTRDTSSLEYSYFFYLIFLRYRLEKGSIIK